MSKQIMVDEPTSINKYLLFSYASNLYAVNFGKKLQEPGLHFICIH